MRIISAEPMRKKDKEFHKVLSAYTPLLNKYCGTLPRFINYACLIQLYTLFEDRGVVLCNELKKRDKTIPLKLGEFGKPNFDTIKTYLTKLCSVEYKYWDQIQLLAKLRHQIVHTNGHTENEKLIAEIKKTKGLRIYEPYNPKVKHVDNDNVDFQLDHDNVPPELEKKKPLIIVKNEYVDYIMPIVAGLFDKVFQDKKFGDPSPFTHQYADAPLICTGSGKTLKVQVVYND